MFKFLEKIAINFLINRGYTIDINERGYKYKIIKNENLEKGSPVFLENNNKKSVIINLRKKTRENKFVKEFEQSVSNKNNINNEDELDKLI